MRTQHHDSQPDGFWLVMSAGILWGTIGAATQAIYNLDSTSSLFINLTRSLVATPVLLAVCWRQMGTAMFRIERRGLLLMALSGALLAISQGAYFIAIQNVGVTVATLLAVCLAPLIVTAGMVSFGQETLTLRGGAALLCALIGAVLLIGVEAPAGVHYQLLPGIAFSLVAAVTYAGMIICGRTLAKTYHPLQVMTVNFGAGTLVFLLFNLLHGFVPMHTPQGWLLGLYLGVMPTALAYLLFQTGLRTVPASTAAIVSLLEPVVAGILSWLLFGERLAGTGIIGAVLLIVSLYLLSMKVESPVVSGMD